MFSNDRLIELTFHSLYFIFEYYSFIELQFNQYKLLFFVWFNNLQLPLFWVLVIIFVPLLVDLFVWIYRININWSWNLSSGVIEIVLWVVSKPYIRISFPTGLWKVVAMVLVRCSDFFTLIEYFPWSKISFNLFNQILFCWLLTWSYHMNWISVHWSWNLSLCVSENCQCDISKHKIWIYFPCRFVEGPG